MVTRFYYTFKELLELEDNFYPISQSKGMYWLIGELADRVMPEDTTQSIILMKHVWLNLKDNYILYIDVKHPRWAKPEKPDIEDVDTEGLATNIWSLFEDTKEYYSTLITLYSTELANLMSPVTTTTESNGETRFNDTPQNVQTGDAYAADNYSTNVTKTNSGSTISSDNMTKMARIDEVQKMLRNLYADWAFEFNKLIVGE